MLEDYTQKYDGLQHIQLMLYKIGIHQICLLKICLEYMQQETKPSQSTWQLKEVNSRQIDKNF